MDPRINYFRRLFGWLGQIKLGIFTAVVVMMTLVFALAVFQTSTSVRLGGLFLQLLGLLAAAIGIRDTRRMFGRPSLLQSFRNWVGRWPRLRPKTINVSAESTIGVSATADGYVWCGTKSGAALDERISALEKNLQLLRERLDERHFKLDSDIRGLKAEFRTEREERVAADEALDQRIESASADGLHLAAAGAVWLAFGIIMATAPDEIISLIRLIT